LKPFFADGHLLSVFDHAQAQSLFTTQTTGILLPHHRVEFHGIETEEPSPFKSKTSSPPRKLGRMAKGMPVPRHPAVPPIG